jgi:protein SCO1/2
VADSQLAPKKPQGDYMKKHTIVVIAGVLAVVIAVALASGVIRKPSPATMAASDVNSWHRLDANENAADFSLINQDGRRVGLKDFAGRAVVMTFFFSHCVDVCPMQLEVLDGLMGELDARAREQLVLVGITIDSARDTPERLKTFLGERGLDARRWQLLTGSAREATRIAADYGIVARPSPFGDFVHNSVYILIDPKGVERVEFHGIATPRGEIVRAIRSLLPPPTSGTGS